MTDQRLPTSPPTSAAPAESSPDDVAVRSAAPRGRHVFTVEEQAAGGALGLEHGMKSKRLKISLEPVTQQKVEELKVFLEEHGSRWMQRADEPLILQTARNLVLIDQMWSYLTQRGAMDTHGRPRGVMKMWHTAQNTLTRQLSALGCSPLARAELGANLAASKLDAAQAMRYARPRSDRASATTADDASMTAPVPIE